MKVTPARCWSQNAPRWRPCSREITRSGSQDREAEQETGDSVDTAQPLESEGVDDAVEASLRQRLEAIERAEQRLADGTFGLSVRSGDPIPDERLEVAPTAGADRGGGFAAARQ